MIKMLDNLNYTVRTKVANICHARYAVQTYLRVWQKKIIIKARTSDLPVGRLASHLQAQ